MKVLIPYKTEQRKENEEVRQIRTFILILFLFYLWLFILLFSSFINFFAIRCTSS